MHLALVLLLAACPTVPADDDTTDDDDSTQEPSPYTLDDVLQLPHVQAKGTHNSYHLEPDPAWDASHRYSHAPLDVQLEEQGVRQFELDLHYRTGTGFEIFHLPSIDEDTTCRALADCMATIKGWSDANRWHLPIVIWIEPKDEDLDSIDDELELLTGKWGDFDQALLDAWGRERIVTPDDVRGAHDTLPDAIETDGWPTLGTMRGKVLFAMLDGGNARDEYVEGNPTAEGRVLVPGSSSPDDPWAALFKINDAQSEAARVTDLVSRGFVVTSNSGSADGDDNAAHWDASLAAGANFLSTDLPGEHPTDWYAQVPDGEPARCNPVSAPVECSSAEVEAL